jgi:hypothetical protein
LLVLLGIGVALRVALSLSLEPAALNQFDANAYVLKAAGGIFGQVGQAPGYGLFLRIPHLVSDQVAFTISVQHALALGTATIAWWALRRLTGSRWLGLIPAGVVVLNADSLLLEHALMGETLFTLLIVGMLAASVAAPDSPHPERWLVAAGALLGVAIWVRYAGIALLPVLAVWTVFAWPGPRLRGLLAAGATVVAPVVALVGLMVVLQGSATGVYAVGQTGGWGLYSRVAPFADCDRFQPPPGTEALCESTPPSERRNPDWYGYDPESPAVRLFGGAPNGNDELGTWARRALLAQPLDYARTVLDDLWLFVDEQPWTNRNTSLIGSRSLSFTLRTPDEHCDADTCRAPPQGLEGVTQLIWTDFSYGAYYAPFEPSTHSGIEFFAAYQRIFRVHGPLVGLLIALAAIGLLAVRGRLARAQWLLSLSGLALLVLPVATTTYNIRYGIPALPILAMASALAPLALRDGAGWLPRLVAAGRRRLSSGGS